MRRLLGRARVPRASDEFDADAAEEPPVHQHPAAAYDEPSPHIYPTYRELHTDAPRRDRRSDRDPAHAPRRGGLRTLARPTGAGAATAPLRADPLVEQAENWAPWRGDAHGSLPADAWSPTVPPAPPPDPARRQRWSGLFAKRDVAPVDRGMARMALNEDDGAGAAAAGAPQAHLPDLHTPATEPHAAAEPRADSKERGGGLFKAWKRHGAQVRPVSGVRDGAPGADARHGYPGDGARVALPNAVSAADLSDEFASDSGLAAHAPPVPLSMGRAPPGDERDVGDGAALVRARIAAFCYAIPDVSDWQHVHELGDLVNATEANGKEAVRTLRRVLRSCDVEPQRRAVRAWGVWSLFAGGRFGVYAANAQLLGILEEHLESSFTPLELRDDVIDVLGALAYRAQTNKQLRAVARLWARVHPDDRPAAGQPMRRALFGDAAAAARGVAGGGAGGGGGGVSGPTGAPTDGSTGGSTDGSTGTRDAVPMSLNPAQNMAPPWTASGTAGADAPRFAHPVDAPRELTRACAGPLVNAPPSDAAPARDEGRPPDAEALQQECHAAHTNASVLLDALAYGGPDNALVPEFLEKTQLSHDWLHAQLPWATQLACDSSAPHALPAGASAGAEAVVTDILEALEHVGEALSLAARLRTNADEQDAHAHSDGDDGADARGAAAPAAPTSSVDHDTPALAAAHADEDTASPGAAERARPSEKALGKRRAIDPDLAHGAHGEPLHVETAAEVRAGKPPLPAIPGGTPACSPMDAGDAHATGHASVPLTPTPTDAGMHCARSTNPFAAAGSR
ncbi:hypothetical protein MSPP1_000539 [Malassezia sp. CBS 17886]|nr:hypothetical protein MSPP1_000539 [Malassezia sp. CBS 17886]